MLSNIRVLCIASHQLNHKLELLKYVQNSSVPHIFLC